MTAKLHNWTGGYKSASKVEWFRGPTLWQLFLTFLELYLDFVNRIRLPKSYLILHHSNLNAEKTCKMQQSTRGQRVHGRSHLLKTNYSWTDTQKFHEGADSWNRLFMFFPGRSAGGLTIFRCLTQILKKENRNVLRNPVIFMQKRDTIQFCLYFIFTLLLLLWHWHNQRAVLCSNFCDTLKRFVSGFFSNDLLYY